MKVTIDTKEDSHEDISKVLGILTNILKNKEVDDVQASKLQENTDTTSMMGMFDEPAKTENSTPPDFTSFLNLANNKEEKKDEDPKIQFF